MHQHPVKLINDNIIDKKEQISSYHIFLSTLSLYHLSQISNKQCLELLINEKVIESSISLY